MPLPGHKHSMWFEVACTGRFLCVSDTSPGVVRSKALNAFETDMARSHDSGFEHSRLERNSLEVLQPRALRRSVDISLHSVMLWLVYYGMRVERQLSRAKISGCFILGSHALHSCSGSPECVGCGP